MNMDMGMPDQYAILSSSAACLGSLARTLKKPLSAKESEEMRSFSVGMQSGFIVVLIKS